MPGYLLVIKSDQYASMHMEVVKPNTPDGATTGIQFSSHAYTLTWSTLQQWPLGGSTFGGAQMTLRCLYPNQYYQSLKTNNHHYSPHLVHNLTSCCVFRWVIVESASCVALPPPRHQQYRHRDISGLYHTCQLLQIFRKLYGIFVILRSYGRRGISLRIFTLRNH